MIPMKDAAFLMIDMQAGFLMDISSLCVPGAAETIPTCARALEAARGYNIPVFHVIREYAVDGSNVEYARLPIWIEGDRPISMVHPGSLQRPDALKEIEGERVLVKPSYSAFFKTDLEEQLNRLHVHTVILTGTTTPNCIRTTCYDALSLGFNVVILEDATSSRSEKIQKVNIKDMKRAGASILTVDEFCEVGLENAKDYRKKAFKLMEELAAESE